MRQRLIVVDGYRPTAADDTNLREAVWEFALDQRAFGPRRLLVAFADADGSFRGLAYARRPSRPELALEPCIRHVGLGSAAAIAYCDEAVDPDAPPPPDLPIRFAYARQVAAVYGIRLIDWIACDDQTFRSSQLALFPDDEWWSVATD
jgi:hypothetical protein